MGLLGLCGSGSAALYGWSLGSDESGQRCFGDWSSAWTSRLHGAAWPAPVGSASREDGLGKEGQLP